MDKPKKKDIIHDECGEDCGCKYLEGMSPCEIKAEAINDTIDQYEAYNESRKLDVGEIAEVIKAQKSVCQKIRPTEKCVEYDDCDHHLAEEIAAHFSRPAIKLPEKKELKNPCDDCRAGDVNCNSECTAYDNYIESIHVNSTLDLVAEMNGRGNANNNKNN